MGLVVLIGALSINQVVLNYLVMALMFSVAFHLSRPAGSTPTFWPGLRSQLKLILSAMILYSWPHPAPAAFPEFRWARGPVLLA